MNLPEFPYIDAMLVDGYNDKQMREYGASCYAAAEAAGEKKLLDRLTAGVEMPEAMAELGVSTFHWLQDRPQAGEKLFTHTQLQEYGAAQRLLGAREEREECAKLVDAVAKDNDGDKRYWDLCCMNIADFIRLRGEA